MPQDLADCVNSLSLKYIPKTGKFKLNNKLINPASMNTIKHVPIYSGQVQLPSLANSPSSQIISQLYFNNYLRSTDALFKAFLKYPIFKFFLNKLFSYLNTCNMKNVIHKPKRNLGILIIGMMMFGIFYMPTASHCQSSYNIPAQVNIDFVGLESVDMNDVQWKEKTEMNTFLGGEKSRYDGLAQGAGNGTIENYTYTSFSSFISDLKTNALQYAISEAIVLSLKKLDTDFQATPTNQKPDLSKMMNQLYPELIASMHNTTK